MTFHRDLSKPGDHPEHHFSFTVCSGSSPGSIALQVPKHWHKHHDEYMQCVAGEIEVHLDGEDFTAKAGDPTIFIERRRVHGFEFAKGQRVVLKEMTRPTGEFKQRFFEDVFTEAGFWGAMRGFADGDTYLALPVPGWLRWLDEIYMFVMGLLVMLVYPRKGPRPESRAPVDGGEKKKGL